MPSIRPAPSSWASRSRRTALAALAVATLLTGFVSVPPAQADDVVGSRDQFSDDRSQSIFMYGDRVNAQTFVPSRTGLLTSVSLSWAAGFGAGRTTPVSIQAVDAGVGSSAVLASGTMSTSDGWQTTTFSEAPLLTAGVTYALVVVGSDTVLDFSDNDPYPRGGMWWGGAVARYDYAFRTYSIVVGVPTTLVLEGRDGALTATWAAAVPDGTTVTGYQVETRPQGGAWSAPVETASLSTTVAGLANGDTVDVRVRAVSPVGPGQWSETASATPWGSFDLQGTVVVDRVPAVGGAVTASVSGWAPAPSVDWSWTVDGRVVSASAAYVPAPADVGRQLAVSVTASSPGVRPVTVTTPAGAVELGTGSAAVTVVGAQGAAVDAAGAGTSVRASVTGLEPSSATVGYQWIDGRGSPLPDGTSSSFLLTGAQAAAGESVSVVVSVEAPGYAPLTTTSGTVAVVPGALVGTVTTDGAAVGRTTTATPTGWTDESDLRYQWSTEDGPIAGATQATYVPGPLLLGSRLSVAVTGTAVGYETRVQGSVPVVVGAGTQALPQVSLVGEAVVGSVLSAAVTTPTVDSAVASWSWSRDGVPVAGATRDSYALTADDLGAVIAVSVVAARAGYAGATAAATSTPVVAGTQVGTVSTASDATAGTALVARLDGWLEGTSFTYRWLSDGIAVEDATGPSFVPTDGDLGHRVAVEVTGSLPGWAPRTVTSAAAGPVSGVPPVVAEPTEAEATAVAGQPFSRRLAVSGAPAPTLTLRGDLPAGIGWDPNTGTLSGTTTVAGEHVLTVVADNGLGDPVETTFVLTVEAGPLADVTVTTTGTSLAADGVTVTAAQGTTIRVSGQGVDQWGNQVDLRDLVVTSDVPTDIVLGDTVAFPHASPHVITVTSGGVSGSLLVEVQPAPVPTPGTAPTDVTPSGTAPTVVAGGSSTVIETADERHRAVTTPVLAHTGGDALRLGALALFLLLVGAALRVRSRRAGRG